MILHNQFRSDFTYILIFSILMKGENMKIFTQFF